MASAADRRTAIDAAPGMLWRWYTGCVGLELGKAEILAALASVFRRFGSSMRLVDTVRERDLDIVLNLFNLGPRKRSNRVLVMFDKEVEG